jgi:hypothetical protein
MRWAVHVARVGERRSAYGVLAGNLKERDHFEGLGQGGRIILKWIFKKWDERELTGLIWLRISTSCRIL